MRFCLLILLFTVTALLITGCATKSRTIRFLEATNLQVSHLPGTGRVEGRHCSHRFLFVSWQSPRIDSAIADALRVQNNKYNALADAEMMFSKKPMLFSSGWLGSEDCVIVVGRPILLTRPEVPPGLYKTSSNFDGSDSTDWDF